MFPLSAQIYFEILALGVAVISWHKLKRTAFQWLLPFLLFIVIIELTGRHIRLDLRKPNAWLYNISVPVEYLFYGYLFYRHYSRRIYRQIAAGFIIAFSIFSVYNIFFMQGFDRFNTNILKTGSFCMILLCCLYFTELLKDETRLNLLSEPMFMLTTGVFLFNTGEFFYSLFSDYLIDNRLDTARRLFSSINNKLIWVLYTCISISIICIRKRHQRA